MDSLNTGAARLTWAATAACRESICAGTRDAQLHPPDFRQAFLSEKENGPDPAISRVQEASPRPPPQARAMPERRDIARHLAWEAHLSSFRKATMSASS
jgi:hypothetical protein